MAIHEKLMIAAGIMLLASLPFFSLPFFPGLGFYVWLAAKGAYGVGVILMWTIKEKNT